MSGAVAPAPYPARVAAVILTVGSIGGWLAIITAGCALVRWIAS